MNASEPRASQVSVFLGPTLSVAAAKPHLDARFLPPAEMGDLYRAGQSGARVIVLIDGAFERVPSPWHKEILWAMSAGIHVFGASSMGALRAAELAHFGMHGVGWVFQQFASGRLEDDDEVAVFHAPGPSEFRAVSDALVNIRCSLDLAVRSEIIDMEHARAMLLHAKSLHYPTRTFDVLVSDSTLRSRERRRVADWLAEHKVDIKAEDAIGALCAVRRQLQVGLSPFQPSFRFNHTMAWQHLLETVSQELPSAAGRRHTSALRST